MKKLFLASSLVFLLAMVYNAAGVAEVPGAVLILDAANNPGHPDVWTNVGTAGGELTVEGTPSALDLAMPGAMYYTGDPVWRGLLWHSCSRKHCGTVSGSLDDGVPL